MDSQLGRRGTAVGGVSFALTSAMDSQAGPSYLFFPAQKL